MTLYTLPHLNGVSSILLIVIVNTVVSMAFQQREPGGSGRGEREREREKKGGREGKRKRERERGEGRERERSTRPLLLS